MDGDPTTGMLVGETQKFPDGTYYDQYRIGGTSLSSPLFAGVMADADQAAGTPLGFVNPLLYKLAGRRRLERVLRRRSRPASRRSSRATTSTSIDAEEGTLTSVRMLDYEGRESSAKATKTAPHQKVALDTAPGSTR